MGESPAESNVLNVWRGGQLLAFSGCDGLTDYENGLCARTAFDGVGLTVVLPATCRVHISDGAPERVLLAGDFFDLVTSSGTLPQRAQSLRRAVAALWRPAKAGTQRPQRKEDSKASAAEQSFRKKRCCPFAGDRTQQKPGVGRTCGAFLDAHHLLIEGPCSVSEAGHGIVVVREGRRTLIASAARLDRSKLHSDLSAAMQERQQWLASIPIPNGLSEGRKRSLMKALSIMKTQVYTPQGRIRHRWTTPDRWPHRAMWLWDSAFHAIGWRHIDPDLAREMVEAVFDCRHGDGMVPHMSSPTASSSITQPPVLGLAARLVERESPERAWIERLYPELSAYVRWDMANRDSDGAGLLEWHIEGNPSCRSGESGMDNSPRFDSAQELDAPDLNAYVAHECEILAEFAERLGLRDEAKTWAAEHRRLCGLINKRLWNEEHNLYVDCAAATGEQSGILSGAGFLPLICGAASDEQARRMAGHLENPDTFGTPLPVATIAASQPEYYSKDMWRGPVWVNLNWLIAYGFSRYGLDDAAAFIRQKTLAEVERRYEEFGVFFEFYDDRCEVAPPQLMRKGTCDPAGPYHHVLHDYGWTAALYVDMVIACDD